MKVAVHSRFPYSILINNIYPGSDGDIDTRSLDVQRGSDGQEVNPTAPRRVVQISDFGLYYNTFDDNIRRRFPLIVEIKPFRTP